MKTLTRLALVLTFVMAPMLTQRAVAESLLQLDMLGGVYDTSTSTIVAPGGSFTVFAILTPTHNASAQEIQELLDATYYLSIALVPKTAPPGGSYGSFAIGLPGTTALNCTETTSSTPGLCPQTVQVTGDMTYGVPPLEQMASLQGFDAGDLSKHSIYETYFTELSFQFDPTRTTGVYNTQDNPGGPISGTGAFYASFVGDSSLLADGFNLHFDLYSAELKSCSRTSTCTDVDMDQFAPYSHDAETTTRVVPEPASATLLLAGCAACGFRTRRRARL